jgi:ribosomal protein S12 methylthiotransferase
MAGLGDYKGTLLKQAFGAKAHQAKSPGTETCFSNVPLSITYAPMNRRIGFVSLGCPKALVDSERILTRLRAEGYETVPTYEDADLVVVNTCGFIDDAVEESLEAIGEAMAANGKVLVTGCLGAKPDTIRARHPGVLGITGPHAYEQVMTAVHEHLPPAHDPFTDLVPPQGIRLTPRHYAYLKISEGCNNKCSFCIIPGLRGRLASRPIGEVLREAESLVRAGVRELLVISQDTSAYGSDIRYLPDAWRGERYETRFLDLARGLGELGAWVRMHYVYPYPHVDKVLPLMAEGKVLPYLDIPFQHASPAVLKRMRRPAASENTLDRIRAWRDICPELALRSTFIVGFRAKPMKTSSCSSTGSRRRNSTGSAVFAIRRWKAPLPTGWQRRFPTRSRKSAGSASWKLPRRSARIVSRRGSEEPSP